MTGQQYTVIADRDKGDDPRSQDIRDGDRYTLNAPYFGDSQVVRIERPVPTTDENVWITDELDSPHPPTREQINRDDLILTIRDVSADHHGNGRLSLSGPKAARIADAVLALIQNGAVR